MFTALRSRKAIIAAAVLGVGALGVGVASAVTAGGSGVSPGPSGSAGDHPNSHATTVILPAAATAGPAANERSDNAVTPQTGVPDAAPAPSHLSTALAATGDTPGNTVLNDLTQTSPGADRGATIASNAQTFAANQAATAAAKGLNHKP